MVEDEPLLNGNGAAGLTMPTAGLIAHYPFNGNGDDASGNGHHAGAVNSPVLVTDRHGTAREPTIWTAVPSISPCPTLPA